MSSAELDEIGLARVALFGAEPKVPHHHPSLSSIFKFLLKSLYLPIFFIIMAETSSADTRNQNGTATRRRRKYPPATEVLQTQCESPEKPPSRPFTINRGGKPITDDDCFELAIALAKLDFTCLELLHSTVKYVSQDRNFGSKELRDFKFQKLALEIGDQDITFFRNDLFDISRDVSVLISQEYLSSTKLSCYWELLPSSAACFVPAIPLLHEDISLLHRLAVEATELRQKALVVARRGGLENDIETALRQRWICIAKVTFPEMDRMSPQLYKVMSGLTV